MDGFNRPAFNLSQTTPRQDLSNQMTQQKKKKPWWTSVISEAGGVLGGVGGFLVGGPAGAVAGAAGGGALGSTIEQKIRDDKVDWGNVAQSAAFEGVTALGPVKGGKALLSGGKTLLKGGGKEAAKEAAGKAYTTSVFSKGGSAARQSASGLNQAGKAFESQSQRDVAGKVMNAVGLKGSAANKFRNIDDAITKVGSKADTILAGTKKQANALDLLGEMNAKAGSAIVGDRAAYQTALQEANQQILALAKNGKISATDLMGFKRDVSQRLGGAFKKMQNGTALTPQEQAFMDVWGGLDDQIIKIAPQAKNLTKAQSVLIKARPVLDKAQNAKTHLPLIGGTRTATKAYQGSADLLGRMGGTVKSGVPTARSVGTRSLIGGMLAPDATTEAFGQSAEDTTMMQDQGQSDLLGLGGQSGDQEGADFLDMGQSGGLTNESLQQALMQDYVATGGKNSEFLMQLAKLNGVGAEEKPLNSTAAGVVTDLENGIMNIRQLGTDISASGANQPFIGKIRGLNPYDTEAQTLQAGIARVKQVIGKALEGGVLRKEDEVKYAKILPTLNDSDAVASNKINAITDDLTRKLTFYKQNLGGGGGGIDLQSLNSAQQSY